MEAFILVQTLIRTVGSLLAYGAECGFEAGFPLAALVTGDLFGDGNSGGGVFLDEGGRGELVTFLPLHVLKIKSVRGGGRRRS